MGTMVSISWVQQADIMQSYNFPRLQHLEQVSEMSGEL